MAWLKSGGLQNGADLPVAGIGNSLGGKRFDENGFCRQFCETTQIGHRRFTALARFAVSEHFGPYLGHFPAQIRQRIHGGWRRGDLLDRNRNVGKI